MLKDKLEQFKKIKNFDFGLWYKQKFVYWWPILLLNVLLFIFSGRIPYLNLYQQELWLVLLLSDWFILTKLFPATVSVKIFRALTLFFLALVLQLMGQEQFVEAIGNLVYFLLFYYSFIVLWSTIGADGRSEDV